MTTKMQALPKSSKSLKFTLLLIIMAVGGFYRFYQLQIMPPGDGFDPAYYGLDALRILNGEFPIYFETNFGREVLFSYLVAAVYLVTGPGTLGIHIASAIVAVLTIPAVFLVADEFFKRDEPGVRSEWGGILAALIMALSFWHLMWSRYSVRAILIPLFVSLLCYFLLRALRTQKQRYFVFTGLVMGAGFYTYQLAQLFPILVGIGIGLHLIAQRKITKEDGKHIALTYGTALLVALPLIIYAVQNPTIFNQRVVDVYVLEEVSERTEQIEVLRTNIWNVIKMYTVEGDRDPLINIPERPSLNPFLSITFLIGVLLSLYRWRRPHYLFLIGWLVLMSAPAFLAESAAMSKRALGALPVVTIFISMALLMPFDQMQRQQKLTTHLPKWHMLPLAMLVTFIILFTGVTTYRDLFHTWGTDPGLYTHYNVGVAEIGKYIASLPEDETIYLSPTWIDHASLKLHSNNRAGIHAYNGRHCFVYPQATTNKTNYIIVPGDEANSLPLLKEYFPQGEITHNGTLANDDLYYVAYEIPPATTAAFNPQQLTYTNWDNEVAILGYDVSSDTFNPGDTITVNLYFRPLANMSANYTSYIHLLGPTDPETGNSLWGQVDREPCFQSYPTSWWQGNEVIRDTFNLTISPDAPTGEYQLTMGFYHWPELSQLVIVDSDRQTIAEAIIAQTIEITPK